MDRRSFLVASLPAAAVAVGALPALAALTGKLRDRVREEELRRLGLEEYADLDVPSDAEVMTIDPDTGELVKVA